jgi:heme/copper-type cytochrome/quinol oxidase subunit 3
MEVSEERLILDVSKLPSVAIGRKNVSWLANIFYMAIEGTMFLLVVASYFYLRTRSVNWPPAPQLPPPLRFGLANAVLFIFSALPARWVQKQALVGNRTRVRGGLLVLDLFILAITAIRWFEFKTLNCRWTNNAYASTIWILLAIHTGHLIAEWVETSVMVGIACTRKMEGNRLADASNNSDYWYFVIMTGLLCDFVIYGTPHFL